MMEKATREYLARVAREIALVPFHGAVDGLTSNLEPIVRPFPTWNVSEADGLWCAAFVYYCCREAGFEIPYRPKECRTCHLAGCLGWEEFAAGDGRIEYLRGTPTVAPEAGDIVIYDRVFENKEHDHMGIVLETLEHTILAAEGNVANASGIIERAIDEHIRAIIRIPDGYRYGAECKPGVSMPQLKKTVVEAILAEGDAEFASHGDKYLIQQESNKGCHYLSLWRLTPKAACLCRVCFEIFDGISEETIEELLDQQLSDGYTVRDMLQSPDTVTTFQDR